MAKKATTTATTGPAADIETTRVLPESRPDQAVQRVADTLPDHGEVMKQVLTGNLAALTAEQQSQYLLGVCKSLGLNPMTAPLAIMTFKGRTVLYAKKDCTEQLRKLYQVSIFIVDRQILDDLYIVTARAALNSGRTDENVGVVNLRGLAGEERANAIMKAHTKAVRRVTLSICGLGCLDEAEVEERPHQQPAALNGTPAAAPTPAAVVQSVAQNMATPQQPQQPVAPQPAELKPEPITDSQANLIDELVKKLGITNEQFAGRLVKLFGNGDPTKLTEVQAAQVIGLLETAVKKKGAA